MWIDRLILLANRAAAGKNQGIDLWGIAHDEYQYRISSSSYSPLPMISLARARFPFLSGLVRYLEIETDSSSKPSRHKDMYLISPR